MKVALPIEDPEPIEGVEPELLGVESMREPGEISLTQRIVEQVMKKDFPTVAMLGIETYVSRLSRMEYTTGFQVFWLDRLPDVPGYTLVAMEPPASKIGPDGELLMSISYKTGPAGAARAEEVRRWIPPGKTHTNE